MASNKEWPAPIADAAYIGPLGEYVKRVEEHDEGDPAAILVQTLVAFGNAVGRSPHFLVGDLEHHTNLNTVIVGNTSQARKGTAYTRAFSLVAAADIDWGDRNRGEGGLSSAEGLILAVSDDPQNPEADKRLLAMMGEFGETLEKMSRDGNTLSNTIRQAWDGTTMKVRTRKDPLRATGAHVSIIGHITEADLRDGLTTTNIRNGFANRFLWVVARRQRKLPFGGTTLRIGDLPEYVGMVRDAIEWAQQRPREIKMSGGLRDEWERLYCDELEFDGDPLASILDRAAPQIRRLALVYAVSEKSKQVERRHLRAARAVWAYSQASVNYVFESAPRPGLPGLIERLLAAGRLVTQSEISKAAQAKNSEWTADKITPVLDAMVEDGLIERVVTRGRGRPKTEFRRR